MDWMKFIFMLLIAYLALQYFIGLENLGKMLSVPIVMLNEPVRFQNIYLDSITLGMGLAIIVILYLLSQTGKK